MKPVIQFPAKHDGARRFILLIDSVESDCTAILRILNYENDQ